MDRAPARGVDARGDARQRGYAGLRGGARQWLLSADAATGNGVGDRRLGVSRGRLAQRRLRLDRADLRRQVQGRAGEDTREPQGDRRDVRRRRRLRLGDARSLSDLQVRLQAAPPPTSDHIAARIEERQPQGESCGSFKAPSLVARLESLPVALSIADRRDLPVPELVDRGIAHVRQPRSAATGRRRPSPTPCPRRRRSGRRTSCSACNKPGSEKHNPYATLADAAIDCPLSQGWLTRARQQRKDQYGMFWDSEDLAAVHSRRSWPGRADGAFPPRPAAQRHRADHPGQRPVLERAGVRQCAVAARRLPAEPRSSARWTSWCSTTSRATRSRSGRTVSEARQPGAATVK